MLAFSRHSCQTSKTLANLIHTHLVFKKQKKIHEISVVGLVQVDSAAVIEVWYRSFTDVCEITESPSQHQPWLTRNKQNRFTFFLKYAHRPVCMLKVAVTDASRFERISFLIDSNESKKQGDKHLHKAQPWSVQTSNPKFRESKYEASTFLITHVDWVF